VSFTVESIRAHRFRSYTELVLELNEGLTILAGPNAAGKTNIIEALQLLTSGESFRNPQWIDLVHKGSSSASLHLSAREGERLHEVDLEVGESGRRTYKINGKMKRAAGDLAGTIPCVVFTPEDLRIVKDSPARRRDELDGLGRQLSGTYARLKFEYDRVVRQRNTLLRQGDAADDDLSPWDERLVSLGARLHSHRRALFEKVLEAAAKRYSEFADDGPLEGRYIPSWNRDRPAEDEILDPAAAIEESLRRGRSAERARGVTLVGPHRDDITFILQGHDARIFASQGQQRSIALALKAGEVAVVESVSGARPLLLLDDVMSELDESRRTALAGVVGEMTQTIITTTNLGYFTPEFVDHSKVVLLP
jgi:DNA replication and repair protein RecF